MICLEDLVESMIRLSDLILCSPRASSAYILFCLSDYITLSIHIKLQRILFPPQNLPQLLRLCYYISHGTRIMSSRPLQTFTLFPLLPPELRLKIWQKLAAQPHTLELGRTSTDANGPQGQWFSRSQPPAIFSVCSESRAAALHLFSALTFSDGQTGLPCRKPLYINFETGTLCIGSDFHPKLAEDLLFRNAQLKESLKYLAISSKLWTVINPVYLDPGWDGGNVWPRLNLSMPRGVEIGSRALKHVELQS